MVAARYEFLHRLHQALQPRGYLEIGVQTGGSLTLATCPALGIDPAPIVTAPMEPHHNVYVATSDMFFEQVFAMNPSVFDLLPKRLDLVFIDGMHLAEFALRDFIGCEKVSHSGTVIVFDDVLPYGEWIATREQPPGDWTGDVWKIMEVLDANRPDLRLTLVDTQPTGSLMVTGLNPHDETLVTIYQDIEKQLIYDVAPHADIIQRVGAVSIDQAVEIAQRGIL